MKTKPLFLTLFLIASTLLINSPTQAFKPLFFHNAANNSFESAESIDDLSLAPIIYGRLQTPGEVDFYSFSPLETTKIPVSILVPYEKTFVDFHPTIVIFGEDITPSKTKIPFSYPSNQKPLALDPTTAYQTVTYDGLLLEHFFQGPKTELTLAAGKTYTIAVHDPTQGTGDYAVTIGESAPNDPASIVNSLRGIVRVKLFSSDWQQGLAYLLILFTIIFLFSALILNLFRDEEKKKTLIIVLANLIFGIIAIITAATLITRPKEIISFQTTTLGQPSPQPTPQLITNAKLNITAPQRGATISPNTTPTLQLAIEGYSIAPKQNGIVILIDDQMPTMLYDTKLELTDLEPGKHILWAFLTDDKQQALNTEHTIAMTWFTIDETATAPPEDGEQAPTPVSDTPPDLGTTSLALTEPILLYSIGDQPLSMSSQQFSQQGIWVNFLTLNAHLSADTYQLAYTIDEEDPSYLTSPQTLTAKTSGLAPGNHVLRLWLVSLQEGEYSNIEGDYTSRTIEFTITDPDAPASTPTTTPTITPTATSNPSSDDSPSEEEPPEPTE